MPPLILHNVPDDELYTGNDGIQRPYAMIFPTNEEAMSSTRARKPVVAETGSFGKASTRRLRTRSKTPGVQEVVKEDPTLAAADAIFTYYLAKQTKAPESSHRQRLPPSSSLPNLSMSTPVENAANNGQTMGSIEKEPTEVILRGFGLGKQWAAIADYERIGGLILEDYPRDAPPSERRFKMDSRDAASLRRKAMSAQQKAKAMRYAGGEHWIKITFDSREGAEAAIDSSPQIIHGFTVYAELYRGVPPSAPDEEIWFQNETTQHTPSANRKQMSRSTTTPNIVSRRGLFSGSPPDSHASTETLDTATISTTSGTASSATVTSGSFDTLTHAKQPAEPQNDFCTIIPTAKRVQLRPAEQALMPSKTWNERIVSRIPLVSWFSSDIIGPTIPSTESGEFDWAKASLYWKLIYWLDRLTGWFDVAGNEKQD